MPPKSTQVGKKFPLQVAPKQPPQQVQKNNSTSGLDEETENKFELELCWCIQQLEITLQTNKLPERQAKDANKNLNHLRSSNIPLIKKRQIMRTTFGDYREKMKKEEVKMSKNVSTVKFTPGKSEENKSIFLKKANTELEDKPEDKNTNNLKSNKTKLSTLFSNNSEPFKFNFSAS